MKHSACVCLLVDMHGVHVAIEHSQKKKGASHFPLTTHHNLRNVASCCIVQCISQCCCAQMECSRDLPPQHTQALTGRASGELGIAPLILYHAFAASWLGAKMKRFEARVDSPPEVNCAPAVAVVAKQPQHVAHTTSRSTAALL
jgi:hypothetical protein